MISCW